MAVNKLPKRHKIFRDLVFVCMPYYPIQPGIRQNQIETKQHLTASFRVHLL